MNPMQILEGTWHLSRDCLYGVRMLLGCFWDARRHLGVLLASSWEVLGLSWDLLGRCWDFLVRSWVFGATFGVSLVPLGSICGLLGLLCGRSWML